MTLVVIEGGRAALSSSPRRPSTKDVFEEAARRRRACGYDAHRARELVTGTPIPAALHYLQLQIGYAAEALARLDPIPPDFRSDGYWPAG